MVFYYVYCKAKQDLDTQRRLKSNENENVK